MGKLSAEKCVNKSTENHENEIDKEQDQDDLQERKQESFLATLIIFDRHFKHSWKLFKYQYF